LHSAHIDLHRSTNKSRSRIKNQVSLTYFLTLDLSLSTCSNTLGDTASPPWLSSATSPCHWNVVEVLCQCITPGLHGLHGLLLPCSGYHVSACLGILSSSFYFCGDYVPQPLYSCFPQHVLTTVSMPVLCLISSFRILSFHVTHSILLCHVWFAASNRFILVTVMLQVSAPYRGVDKTSVSYRRILARVVCSSIHYQTSQKLHSLTQFRLSFSLPPVLVTIAEVIHILGLLYWSKSPKPPKRGREYWISIFKPAARNVFNKLSVGYISATVAVQAWAKGLNSQNIA